MHAKYSDIRSLIDKEPLWFDENAVPRYCEFHPWECANIYARQAALLLIECQGCAKPYTVALSWGPLDPDVALERRVRNFSVHFGDPPNACEQTCFAGATMNSIPIRCLQFWKRIDHQWQMIDELSNLSLTDQSSSN